MQGAGLFSSLKGYVKGAGGMHRGLGSMLGRAGRTAAYGAGVGGIYGAFGLRRNEWNLDSDPWSRTTSSDLSAYIGGAAKGAMMGAGLALGGRYARAGARGAGKYLTGNGPVTYGGLALNTRMGALGAMRGDLIRSRIRVNRGFNNFKAMSRGFMSRT